MSIPLAKLACNYATVIGTLMLAGCASNAQNDVDAHPSLAEHAPAKAAHHDWAYTGGSGPEHWGGLREEFAACSEGKLQSPIDLQGASTAQPTALEFNYRPSRVDVLSNGHNMQASFAPGNTLTVDGTTYELLQVHHHHPSEHVEAGQATPLELHFVHIDAQGHLAVIGVLFDEGPSHPTLLPVLHEGKAEINPADLLPAQRAFINCSGSLTTPPCTEGVTWIVLKQHATASRQQLDEFARVSGTNARPSQPRNGRAVRIR